MNFIKKALLLILVLAIALAAPGPPSRDRDTYLARFVDPSVSPRDDFFRYAVGRWLKDNPIPAAERSWGVGHAVQEETYARLIALSERAMKAGAPPGSNAQKIGDFWHAAMDSETIAAQGMAALEPEFARIRAINDPGALHQTIAHLQYLGVNATFTPYIYQDAKNSDRYMFHLWQGGLGLPERSFYFDDDERSRMLRREYVTHVARMLELLGDDAATALQGADRVMSIETALARSSRRLEDLRDPYANYNAMSVQNLSKLVPSIRWRPFLTSGHVRGVDTVIVGQPEFLERVEKELRARSLDEWKTYLRWQLAHAYAAQAGGKFDAEHFRFYGTILNGTSEQRPRWKRALDQEEGYLGDALGQLYVGRYFPPRTKERYRRLTEEIFVAFGERIQELPWMSDATKARAMKKLNAVTRKIGYPERWRDYSNYRVERDSFLANCKRGNAWLSDFYIAKLHKPVDRTEWEMTPQTYNAYYNSSNNEIVLPAAAFALPGIPDSLVDDAIVYAYAGGATIGHEITHGFDDEGRQFDERGNLENWWTPEDEAEFKRRASLIVRQFDAYVVGDSLRVNGEATQGENIADLGGMVVGWDAFRKTRQYREGKSIGGFTPAQRYFIGWAIGWMNEIRPENLAVRIKTDVHAPSPLRVVGPATNLPPFYQAFGVRPGDAMYRADSVRVEIW